MASRLSEGHIRAQARLRAFAERAVGTAWTRLPGYDEENVDPFVRTAVPIVTAAQRRSAALMDAYLALVLGRAALGVPPADVTGAAVRNGADPRVVYRRPFVTVWTALQNGVQWEDAVASGLERATSTAAMDVQLSMRATANVVQEADDNIYGYQRVADGGACAFCQEVDGAYVKSGDAMPLHNRCGCGLEPLTTPHPRAAKLPSGVAVHQHGELGPILADPAHDFTTASEIH